MINETRECILCKRTFTRESVGYRLSDSSWNKRMFCSSTCKGKLTGKGHWNYGRKFTDEHRSKLSLSHRGNTPSNKGKGNRTVLERIKSSKEWKEIKKLVFERDNYTCQLCGYQGDNLHPDHILPKSTHPDSVLDINNIRTLCAPCHRKTDTYGWRLVNKKTL